MNILFAVIMAVISFIFYIAKSVEKQNEAERKRRAAQTGKRQRSGTKNVLPLKPQKDELKAGAERTVRLPASHLSEEAPSAPSAVEDVLSGSRPPAARRRSGSALNRQELKRAYLFSLCLAKPRARDPHPYFKK